MSKSYEIIGSIAVNPSLLVKEKCLNPQEKTLKVNL